MKERSREFRMVDESLATALERVHKTQDTASIDIQRIESLIAGEDETVTIDSAIPTGNPARPRSILTIDCTTERGADSTEEIAVEILCSEQTHIPDDVEGTVNEDGMISFEVSDLQRARVENTYETLEIIRYDKR